LALTLQHFRLLGLRTRGADVVAHSVGVVVDVGVGWVVVVLRIVVGVVFVLGLLG
jgi:hypothetical protein